MNWWINEVKQTLLPKSQEQHDLEKAMKEWYWDKTVFDVVPDDFDRNGNSPEAYFVSCELCHHYPLRYIYRIENRKTHESLWIGSECYKKFDDEFFKTGYSTEEHSKNVQKLIRERHKNLEKQNVHYCLDQLLRIKDQKFVTSLKDYYDEHGAFTPNQLKMIISILASLKIDHNPKFFKIKIRRQREKDQLLHLDETIVKNTLWIYLSEHQKIWYISNQEANN